MQRTRIDGALDMFNALNSNVVLSENQNYGTTLGQPQAVLQGRLLRLSAQIKFWRRRGNAELRSLSFS